MSTEPQAKTGKPTSIKHLPHYTVQDIENADYATQWIEQKKYTQAALARLARISPSTLNQILKGSYPTSPSKLLSTVMSAIARVNETENQPVPVVETGMFRLALSACNQARTQRNFAVLTAHVGIGKTFALKHYAENNANTYLIQATPLMSVSTLVRLLAKGVTGYDAKGSLDEKFQDIVTSLSNTDSLIIIDEAETLTPKQLHTIRRIRDIANVGVVLAGTEYLRGLIKPEGGQFDQIRSRTGFFPATITEINYEDTAALIQASFISEEVTDDVINAMHEYAKGSARMLVEGLISNTKKYRAGRPLDDVLIDAVATQVMSLPKRKKAVKEV